MNEKELKYLEQLNSIGMELVDYEDKLYTTRKATVKCCNGHLTTSTIRNILKTGRCVRCERLQLYHKAIEILQSYSFDVIIDEESFKNQNSNIQYTCDKGHKQVHSVTTIVYSGCKCSECRKYKTFDDTILKLESEGYEVITKRKDFTDAKMKIKYRCSKGHHHATKLSHLADGIRCAKCKPEKVAEKNRIHLSEIVDMFTKECYEILNGSNEYKDLLSIFKVKCNKGHIYKTTAHNFKRGIRCKECHLESRKGENCHLWNGGISNINSHLRTCITEWKKESLQSSNYNCFITGKNGKLEVHHHKNFKDIVMETISELNLEILPQVKDYGEDILKIEELCIKKHYEYGLGIVMMENIHTLFHKIYSKSNNTMEQVLEFKQDYLSGKFDDVLSRLILNN